MPPLGIENYLKTLPEDQQRRIKRGSRLLNYIIAKRCKHPEMLADTKTPRPPCANSKTIAKPATKSTTK